MHTYMYALYILLYTINTHKYSFTYNIKLQMQDPNFT